MDEQKRYEDYPMNDDLRLDNVSISLEGRELLSLDTTISGGEVFTVMGPSGSGKSSLLELIAGFLSPDFSVQGRIVLGGKDITGKPAEKTGIGLLFQDPLLFPHLSVGGNLEFGLPGDCRQRRARVDQALKEVGLPGYEGRDPATLSGGQKARVALMRLLLSQPRAVLLDEPFSRLDTALRDETRAFVFEHLRDARLPAIMVTHDEADARAAQGRIVNLEEREGTRGGPGDQASSSKEQQGS